MSVLFLKESEIKDLISIPETIETVESAFEAKGRGEVQMPPKSYVYFDRFNGDFRAMPAYLEEMGAAGVKVVNVHPDNPEKNDLRSVMATIVLLSPETGEPLSVMSGTKITDLRTGAASAVAAKYLAREGSEKIGFIGTGTQARTQLSALSEIFDFEKGWAYSDPVKSSERFSEEMSGLLEDLEVVENPKDAVINADIVVSTTPSESPIINSDWVSPGTHINAIGADAEGKRELDSDVLKGAKIVVDEWEQASHSGEINVPLSEGKLTRDDVHAEIGEIVTGDKVGRLSEDEVTVFDSTGLAIQDIATAWKIYEQALNEDGGEEIALF